MRTVHQVVPTISPRDAVGNHTLALREILRDLGFDSQIYSMFRHPELTSDTHHIDHLPQTSDVLIYQFSIGSPVADRWARHSAFKIANYHNITPLSLVGKWDGLLAAEVQLGREQMARYAEICDHVICDSDFNKSEMEELGYRSTKTIPVLFDQLRGDPDQSKLSKLKRTRSGTQILFVGRIAPNKAHHDLVAAVKTLREVHGDDAHMHFVGTDGPPSYKKVVENIVKHANMRDHVTFHGSVSSAELIAHYQAADVFCCLSDHEGFCVPVIEAMHHGLPVVAFDCSAVGETVASGGLLLTDKSPLVVASAIFKVSNERDLADRLRAAGRRRSKAFATETVKKLFRDEFQALLSVPK